MKQRLLTSVLVLAWFLPISLLVSGKAAGPFEGDRQPALRKPAALYGAEITYFVEWNIHAKGSLETQHPDYTEFEKREITIGGEAFVHESTLHDVQTIPMELTITDDIYRNLRAECSDDHDWRSITDPQRYYGGPDPFWEYPGIFHPDQEPDGSWYMDNPFSDWAGFISNGQLTRVYNYRNDSKWYDTCGSHDIFGSWDLETTVYAEILRPLRYSDKRLVGDPTGTVFSLNTEYTVEDSDDIPLTVNFHATVRVGGCKDLPAPIDISNSHITILELDLQAEDTTPDEETTLQARVTCQGVPVVNAPVEVMLKAKEGSGGHNHYNGKRPRGSINGVEITAANPSVTDITDSDGAVTFAIRPGRDLTDKLRGIAGWYIVDAKVLRADFTPPPSNSASIHAYLDLEPLPDDQSYVLTPPTQDHPEPFFGTPDTVDLIDQANTTWNSLQAVHNSYLLSNNKPLWPIIPLRIFAVSLKEGGLFDTMAEYPGDYMWKTPYKGHHTGTDMMFWPDWPAYLDEDKRLWFVRLFRELGDAYGDWFYDFGTHYNLRFDQAPGSPPESTIFAPDKSPSADPDIAASAALVDPEGRFVVGAGQTVTYAVGVENLVPDTVASGVDLRAELPEGLNFISADPTPTSMADPRTPVWEVGSLPDEGAPRIFDVTAQVDPSVATGALLTVTATATTSSLDTDPANNQFEDWSLTVQPPGPDLVVRSDLNDTALTVGEPVTFTVSLGNEGNAPAANSWLELTAPEGITITETDPTASVIPNGVHWAAGDLAPGGWQTFTTCLQVDPGLLDLVALRPELDPEYPLPFLMTAGSDGDDINPASDQLQVDKRAEMPGPDLFVGLQADGAPAPGVFEVGQVVTYTLSYGNFGNRKASAVTAELRLWPGLTLLGSQPAPTTNQLDPATGVRTLTWNLGELSVGEDEAIELQLRVDDVAEVGSIIIASVNSNNIDLNPADNVVMETRYEAYGSNGYDYHIFLPVLMRW